jgi:glycosyltransferase involved in cell wall biosynthesis
MAQIYSALDVHCGVTMGEGFGIPIIEAQACGTPVIVGDWTSMPELVFSGWKVDKSDAEPIFTNLNAYQFLPHPGAIADKLEMAYQMRGNQDYRKRARDGAVKYEADKIVEKYWKPALAKIEAKSQEIKPTDNLSRNLQVLR